MAGELAWAIKLFRLFFVPIIPYRFNYFLRSYCMGIFDSSISSTGTFFKKSNRKKISFKIPQKIFLGISSCVSFYFIFLAFFDHEFISESERLLALDSLSSSDLPLEIMVMRHTVHYFLALLVLPNLFFMYLEN